MFTARPPVTRHPWGVHAKLRTRLLICRMISSLVLGFWDKTPVYAPAPCHITGIFRPHQDLGISSSKVVILCRGAAISVAGHAGHAHVIFRDCGLCHLRPSTHSVQSAKLSANPFIIGAYYISQNCSCTDQGLGSASHSFDKTRCCSCSDVSSYHKPWYRKTPAAATR